MKHLFLSIFVGLSSVGAAAEDCCKLPLNAFLHLRIEAGRRFMNQEQFEASRSVFQDLAQDTQIQQRKDLLFAVLFGFSLHHIGEKGKLVFNMIDSFSQVIFGIINMIMKLAPVGAFGAMAFTIGKYGIGSLIQLGQLIACFYMTCLLFIFLVLGKDILLPMP